MKVIKKGVTLKNKLYRNVMTLDTCIGETPADYNDGIFMHKKRNRKNVSNGKKNM